MDLLANFSIFGQRFPVAADFQKSLSFLEKISGELVEF